MPVYCVFERSGASQAMFNLAAQSAEEARKLVALNCDVPADDLALYGCKEDGSVEVPWGIILSAKGDKVPITRL
jgi:hypothetical protein